MEETDVYLSIGLEASSTFRDRGSKFISFAIPVTTEEQAKARLEQYRKHYHDASHHCFAYVIGAKGEIHRNSDDGEPGGTAGLPILNQIRSYGLSDVMVVVVRYFGGTKLGSSGLISAYKTSAREALQNAQTIKVLLKEHFELKFAYEDTQAVSRILDAYGVEFVSQQYAENCTVQIRVRKGQAEAFRKALQEASNGKAGIRSL